MNDDGTLYSIGDLARRTGLTVKAIRFYSDSGIVPPTERSPAGYRRYGIDAVARLDLVRTLRDLGLDLPTIRKVVDREISLPQVAAAHAEALEAQIRTLRLRRAVLTAVARRGSGPEELDLMHKLAKLSEDERQRLIDDFLGTVFDGLHDHPAFAAVIRSMTPQLPDDPEAEQVTAWVELAELFQDPDFRSTLHRMVQDLATDRARDDSMGLPPILAEAVRAQVEPMLAAGINSASPQADPIIEALTTHYAHILDRPADAELRRRLVARLETMNDPRSDRYFELLAVINGWPARESLAPVLTWTVQALRARMQR
ncbi:MerR family transcriptional regulator [Streptomyces piniterrae]|uniref:MerR family transcriptional regulator n=1 Tax=Streptomyces piniterrae TaxID=2571125 RepID=A0A4U0NV16_9ACTN|nr:MerR family transcriptional regulator [Streptomyces piniterrae]TJZ54094.1 MerR family transcriptional regulator [Streptomyces piniterrae]